MSKPEISPPSFVTRSQLLNFGRHRRYESIRLPGTDRKMMLRIRSLKESERSTYEQSSMTLDGETDEQKLVEAKRRLIVLCVVDDNGEPLLTMDDVKALGELDGAITGFVFDKCREHCGFGKFDIEKLVGNSGAIPAVASS